MQKHSILQMHLEPQPLNKVAILPALVAERIAAGEVIERPASVIKELVENSIDAGATQIEVRLIDGGKDTIEVIDNGSGMSRSDLELSVCRHATSKIHSFEDLERLGTLGFRGEALPSIASVSDLRMTSRPKESAETYSIHAAHTAPMRATSGRVANENFLGFPHGTRIQVSSLFSQIPARLKFLKSSGSENTAVKDIIERLAFTHPEVAFRLFHQDKKILDLPSELLPKRAERLLAQGNPFELLETKIDGLWAIHVLWLKGLSLPNMRSMIQIVNGRTLKDRTLSQAILNPLRQNFLPGHFPALVVKLDIPPDELDVNVHPTKTEVRFLDSGKIFALCSAAIQQLKTESRPTEFVTGPYLERPLQHYFQPDLKSDYSFHLKQDQDLFSVSQYGKFQGILFQTYLMFEKNQEVLLIDQHAAHERIRYEQLKTRLLNRESIESQTLLIPEVIHVDREDCAMLLPKLPNLLPWGFEAEVFSDTSILVRSVPALWGVQGLAHRLKNLFVRLQEVNLDETLVWDEALFEKIAMQACRSSFKGGDVLHEAEAIQLARTLMACQHPENCPHGRPTYIKISETKVEEWFSRKL